MSAHVDVVIVGAGISGIGSAYHLQTMCPDRTYVVLEGRPDIGGTWDLFRYPGVRSDSDMHTLGFSFKPWTEAKAIADGPSIMKYLRETVREHGIERNIRFNTLVKKAEWSSESATWTITAQSSDTGEYHQYTCNFIHMCAGYYSYKEGFTPHFAGRENFRGTIVHPQEWPENLDYSGKKVVVIGSGATAMTIVPSMADKVEHITMLQRSPTYVVARPDRDAINDLLRKFLPDRVAYSIVRKKNTVSAASSTTGPAPSPRRCASRSSVECAKGSGPTSTSTPTSHRVTTRGISASASFPTAISSRRSIRARPVWSPITSTRSPRVASV
jgi:cation diffusion facilitator CzcD-associated flavoprotein CzcO